MTTFDVLKPTLDLHKTYFVEASAGCGKTFSIENIVTRLIMDENKSIDIEKVLVLTFTKEATSELKARIRKSLEAAKDQLESPKKESFEYIQEYINKPAESRSKSISNLNDALAKFDLAQIFTIHKFCFMKLKEFLFEAGLSLNQDPEESSISLKVYSEIVKDFLGFSHNLKLISFSQLQLLLAYHKNDIDIVLQSVVYQLVREVRVEAVPFFKELEKKFSEEINNLKMKHHVSCAKIFEQYQSKASFFKGAVNRQNEIYKPLLDSIGALSKTFESSNIEDFIPFYLVFSKVFDLENLKKSGLKKLEEELSFLSFHKDVQSYLFPILDEACKKENLLAALCIECQKLLEQYFEHNQLLTPNNILTKFSKLVDQKEIALKIKESYGAVIVDEFQDTDPLQWEILSKIFLQNSLKKIPFYLVGDPKQSIYGFRRADIYTYLNAAKMLGISEVSTLNTNYRSQPNLINALNTLFTKKSNSWLSLPRTNSSLVYKPVESFEGIEKKDFKDGKGSIHFILCREKVSSLSIPSKEMEENILFPYFLNEILRAHYTLGMPFSSFAILIRDRFQGKRLKNFLKKHKVPFTTTRPESMQGLFAIEAFLQIYLAALHPKKMKYIHALKINPLLKFTENQFEESKMLLLEAFANLKRVLFEEGFLAFYQMLMQQNLFFENSIYQRLLEEDEGLYIYLELEQMKDLLLQEEVLGLSPYHILKSLEDLSTPEALPEKTYPLRQNFEEDGVQLLTMHMSKGLEFEVVFALGLINEVKAKETLIFDTKNNRLKTSSAFTVDEKLEHQKEQDAEKMRQLYVTMTRAKQRLYLPVIQNDNSSEDSKKSPMNSFLEHLELEGENLKDFISQSENFSFTDCEDDVKVLNQAKASFINLVEPKTFSTFFTKELKHSFTSLSSSFLEHLPDVKAPSDFLCENKNIHNLPAGQNTGVLFHKILEKINFNQKKIDLDPYIINTPYAPWKDVIEKTILELLETPIETQTSTFKLNELKGAQVIKEAEFFFPVHGKEHIDEICVQGDFLQGFIDLICVHNDKYYLIDYKTNWLGDQNSNYLYLEETMLAHQYFMQAKIYKEAFKKYIYLFDKRPFEDCFGGCIYWFIRGLKSENKGLYFIY